MRCSVQLADIELVQGSLEYARRSLVSAINLYGVYPEFFFMDGSISFEKSKTDNYFLVRAREGFEKALEEFDKAMKLEPSDSEPYYELGKIYQKREEFEKAIFCFEKYLYLGGKKEAEVKGYLILMKNENKK